MAAGTLMREAVQARLEAAREGLRELVAERAAAELGALQATPEWSALELLRHMWVWDELAARCLDDWQGSRAWLPVYADEDAFNAEMVAARAGTSLADTLEGIGRAHTRYAGILETCDDAELNQVAAAPWGEQVTRLHLINELAGHDLEHLEQLRGAAP
jgi:hypothetical protein